MNKVIAGPLVLSFSAEDQPPDKTALTGSSKGGAYDTSVAPWQIIVDMAKSVCS